MTTENRAIGASTATPEAGTQDGSRLVSIPIHQAHRQPQDPRQLAARIGLQASELALQLLASPGRYRVLLAFDSHDDAVWIREVPTGTNVLTSEQYLDEFCHGQGGFPATDEQLERLHAALTRRIARRKAWATVKTGCSVTKPHKTDVAAAAIARRYAAKGYQFGRVSPMVDDPQPFYMASRQDCTGSRRFPTLAEADAFISKLEGQP